MQQRGSHVQIAVSRYWAHMACISCKCSGKSLRQKHNWLQVVKICKLTAIIFQKV
jgi:hypothetical protein